MSRKNKAYKRDLKQQVHDKLSSMLAIGVSKRESKLEGTDKTKIFSYKTFETYKIHCMYFVDYIRSVHPECTTLKSARKYVGEWLSKRESEVSPLTGEPLSAWTIQTEAKALNKLYGIDPTSKDYYEPPIRHRSDIKRSRTTVVRDSHFSETNNDELIKFCRGTGLRRREITDLKGDSLFHKEDINKFLNDPSLMDLLPIIENKNPILRRNIFEDALLFDEDNFLLVKGKGGKVRFAPVLGPNFQPIVERVKNTPPNRKVWEYVSTNADIHGYRSDYATSLYKKYSQPIEEIEQFCKANGISKRERIYYCRGDEKGKKLDVSAMKLVSKALGHNRISIVATNYLRGI